MLNEIVERLSKLSFPKDYYHTYTSRLLFDAQTWLRETRKAMVYVIPGDDWTSYSYRILLEDVVCPFFEPEYDKFNEFPTYDSALESGILAALKCFDETSPRTA